MEIAKARTASAPDTHRPAIVENIFIINRHHTTYFQAGGAARRANSCTCCIQRNWPALVNYHFSPWQQWGNNLWAWVLAAGLRLGSSLSYVALIIPAASTFLIFISLCARCVAAWLCSGPSSIITTPEKQAALFEFTYTYVLFSHRAGINFFLNKAQRLRLCALAIMRQLFRRAEV